MPPVSNVQSIAVQRGCSGRNRYLSDFDRQFSADHFDKLTASGRIARFEPDAGNRLIRSIAVCVPVGADKEATSDFQLLAGTNRNLMDEVADVDLELSRLKSLWSAGVQASGASDGRLKALIGAEKLPPNDRR